SLAAAAVIFAFATSVAGAQETADPFGSVTPASPRSDLCFPFDPEAGGELCPTHVLCVVPYVCSPPSVSLCSSGYIGVQGVFCTRQPTPCSSGYVGVQGVTCVPLSTIPCY